jgi:CRP/FNR family cyclic AMP-dependent transcriptional regulator
MAAEGLFLNAPVHLTIELGQVVYEEGDVGTHMFGIVDGAIELRKGDVVVASLGPNEVFGERALIDQLPRNLKAVAATQTTLAEIDKKLFLFLVHETPTFALEIMGALASRLRDYDELFGSLGQWNESTQTS